MGAIATVELSPEDIVKLSPKEFGKLVGWIVEELYRRWDEQIERSAQG